MLQSIKNTQKLQKGQTDFGIKLSYQEIGDYFSKNKLYLDYNIFGSCLFYLFISIESEE